MEYLPDRPTIAADEAEQVIDIVPTDDSTSGDIDEFARLHESLRRKHLAFFEAKARDLLEGMDVWSWKRQTERLVPDSCAFATERSSRTGTSLVRVAGTV